MPDRAQLDEALRNYAQLCLADEQPELVQALRAEALSWMETLAEFEPELSGGLAEGWAYPGCEIRLELLADDAKIVEIALLTRGIEFAPGPARRAGAMPEVLVAEGEQGPVRLVVQDFTQRRNRKHDRTRIRSAELRGLVG
jgi:hypothetical protein